MEPVTTGARVARALSAAEATLANGMLSETAKDIYSRLKYRIAALAGHDVSNLEKNRLLLDLGFQSRFEEMPESTARESIITELIDELIDKREVRSQEKAELAVLAQELIAALGDARIARPETRFTVVATHGGIIGPPPTGAPSEAALDGALRPLIEAIEAAPGEVRGEAEAKLASLKQEAVKGKDANDGVIAKLVDGIVELVPGATSAVVSAFASPILGGIAGPVTSFVLDKLRSK